MQKKRQQVLLISGSFHKKKILCVLFVKAFFIFSEVYKQKHKMQNMIIDHIIIIMAGLL